MKYQNGSKTSVKMLIILLNLLAVSGTAIGEEKIMKLNSMVYCGPWGGYSEKDKYKFPIDTRERARAALSYAYWAPNPEDIRECVCHYYQDLPSCIDRARRKK